METLISGEKSKSFICRGNYPSCLVNDLKYNYLFMIHMFQELNLLRMPSLMKSIISIKCREKKEDM